MARNIAIVDYQAGNLRSCVKAFERLAGKDDKVVVINDPASLKAADAIVLPGQGAFGDCAANLQATADLWGLLEQRVLNDALPFFGICVGMQLLADRGLEYGDHKGFGWIPGTVRAIEPKDASMKIPHMGWNTLDLTSEGREHPVLDGIKTGDHCYFVHSYAFDVNEPKQLFATCNYGEKVTAIVGRDTVFATQFHPEKSQAAGLRMIDNFLQWRP